MLKRINLLCRDCGDLEWMKLSHLKDKINFEGCKLVFLTLHHTHCSKFSPEFLSLGGAKLS